MQIDNKVYNPPKSELLSEKENAFSESIVAYRGGYSASMKKAAIVLIALQVLLSSVGFFTNDGFEPINICLSFCFNVSHIIFFIYLVAKVRGVKVRNNILSEVELGVWGYIWRLWVVQYGALVIGALLFKISGVFDIVPSPSITLTLIFGISTFPIGLGLIWLLFSRSRKEQLVWFVTFFRGY